MAWRYIFVPIVIILRYIFLAKSFKQTLKLPVISPSFYHCRLAAPYCVGARRLVIIPYFITKVFLLHE